MTCLFHPSRSSTARHPSKTTRSQRASASTTRAVHGTLAITTRSCKNAYYTLPEFRTTVTTKFGSGGRYNIGKASMHPLKISVACSASPANYTLPSTLKNSPKTFGVARDKYQKVMLKTAPLVNMTSPGPCAYSYESRLGKDASKFTMRVKTKADDEFSWRRVPDPSNYIPFSTINSMGKFRVSTIRDTGATKFSPPTSVRFFQMSIHGLNMIFGRVVFARPRRLRHPADVD